MTKPVKNISETKVRKREKFKPLEFAFLSEKNKRNTYPLPTKELKKSHLGKLAIGGCVYNGQSVAIWGPISDMVKISHGPIGCGVYSQPALLHQNHGRYGIDSFSSLCFSTHFQDNDIVFGGDPKLSRAIDEINTLFPLASGISVLAECPIGLIGDDIGAVAKLKTNETGKTVVPVLCEGYRGADALNDLRKAALYAWQVEGEKYLDESQSMYDVALICTENGGEVNVAKTLLEGLGLNVISQWPGGSSAEDIGKLSRAKMIICAMPNWKMFTEVAAEAFKIPALYVSFFGPDTCDESLRYIAEHFDESIQENAERIISLNAPLVKATIQKYRPILDNKLYMTMYMFTNEDAEILQTLGIRLGTLYQGWIDKNGEWVEIPDGLMYNQRPHHDTARILSLAKPDLIAPIGQDSLMWRKLGIPQFACSANYETSQGPYWGYAGFQRLAADLAHALYASLRENIAAPWDKHAD